MKITFKDSDLEDLYSLDSKKTGKLGFPIEIVKSYKRKIDMLKNAPDLRTITPLKGSNLEKLFEERYEGCYSIRVNDKYRIIFDQNEDHISVRILELTNHYQ